MDQSEKIANFVGMTGAEESAARNVLEAADWNLETAVELHFASQDAGGGGGGGFGAAASAGAAGAGAGGGDGWGAAGAIGEDGMDDATRAAIAAAQAEMAVDSPEVRKADEHIEDQLFDPQQVSAMQQFQQQQLKKTAVADPFRDLSAGDASKGGLGEMFKTPDELTFKGGFEEARAEAEKCGKLLMVNIQDEQEFHSHMLNRDTWAMPAVQGIIKTHFIFWQQYVSTPEGQTFVNFYRVASKPVVMILDAETKTKLKEWVGFIEPDLLVDNVTAFVEELESANRQKKQRIEAQMAMRAGGGPAAAAASSGAGGGGNPAALTTTLSGPMAGLSAGGGAAGAPAATGTGRAAMTEEEEMEAAIRASLEGAGTDGSSEPAQPARIDSPAVAPAELQPEPAQGTANVSAMAFRLPGGERVQRRFAGDRSLQDAFDFLHLEHGLAPGSYSMVEGMPPKRHEESGSASFADAGLVGRVQVNITAKN